MTGFCAVFGSITAHAAEAIVTPADTTFQPFSSVDGAIIQAAGETEMQIERITRFPNGIPTGEAGVSSAGKLPARDLIHAAVPFFKNLDSHDYLRRTYESVLRVAEQRRISRIAMPLLGVGAYGWQPAVALEIAIDAITQRESSVHLVEFVTPITAEYDRIHAQQIRAFPPTVASGSIGELFDTVPAKLGLRDDPYLWRAMREHFAFVPVPADASQLRPIIAHAFEMITRVDARATQRVPEERDGTALLNMPLSG